MPLSFKDGKAVKPGRARRPALCKLFELLSGEKERTGRILPVYNFSLFLEIEEMIGKWQIIALLCGLLFAGSCSNSKTKTKPIGKTYSLDETRGTQYANLFSIEKKSNGTLVKVKNPWSTNEIYGSYFLVNKQTSASVDIPEGAILVKTPVDNIVVLSTTHLGLLKMLNLKEKLIGIGGYEVYDSDVREWLKEGKLKVVGYSHNLNNEQIIDLNPGLLMASGTETVHDNLEIISRGGVIVAHNIEWMEKDPLGRAEWIKFMAAFFEKGALADSIFKEIEKSYNKIASLGENVKIKPKVLVGRNMKGTWYMPGGESYIAKFLKDAGADYYYKDDTTSGSMPLSFEEVLDKQVDADFWFNPDASGLEGMLEEDERYKNFKALKNGEVYQFSRKTLDDGANDYWETGLVKPHLLLADMMEILHPEILPDHHLVYYEKLK